MEGKKNPLKQRKFRENATGDKNTSTPILEKRKKREVENDRWKEKDIKIKTTNPGR